MVTTRKRDCNWHTLKENGKTIWVKGASGLKLHREIKKMDKFLFNLFKPTAFLDSEYDLIYIGFNGGRKVDNTVETHTTEGQTIRFDFDKHQNVIGVEIEDLISSEEKHEK